MKKRIFHKYILCFLAGMLVVGGISVYAVSTIIDSKEVSYDNGNSNGSYDNVQGSIDELYKRYKDLSGEQDTIYTEGILNGADPVLGDGMIPVTLDSKGNVKYANLYTPWYRYEEKKWANAVILVKSPSKQYKTGDTILEKDIESYFVWIPRYSYKIWDMGNYTSYYNLSKLQDGIGLAANDPTAIRNITGSARLIEIRFGKDENLTTIPTTTGVYYTHPAFTNFGVSGLWVGKFETTGNASNLTVKPNLTSWRNVSIGTFFKSLFNYRSVDGKHNNNLDPHMMKNTEWGAVTYLSYSLYGIGKEININNNSSYLTGYSATDSTNQSSFPGEAGTTSEMTQPYNTVTGYLASTTGNITGVYDMNGGGADAMASYADGYGVAGSDGVKSDLLDSDLVNYSKYFDKYIGITTHNSYNKRILGDATGEMGSFYEYYDKDNNPRIHNVRYGDLSTTIVTSSPWFVRGGEQYHSVLAGQFAFYSNQGNLGYWCASRLVLAVK